MYECCPCSPLHFLNKLQKLPCYITRPLQNFVHHICKIVFTFSNYKFQQKAEFGFWLYNMKSPTPIHKTGFKVSRVYKLPRCSSGEQLTGTAEGGVAISKHQEGLNLRTQPSHQTHLEKCCHFSSRSIFNMWKFPSHSQSSQSVNSWWRETHDNTTPCADINLVQRWSVS